MKKALLVSLILGALPLAAGTLTAEERSLLLTQLDKSSRTVLASLEGVTEATAQVRLTTQQQRSATGQVVETMEQLTDASRQVSATAQQIADAAGTLVTLSADLETTASRPANHGGE